MPSYNKVILMGNLTRDPALAYTQTNVPYVKSGLAVTSKRNGKEEVLFIDFTAWGKPAEAIQKYTKKGTALLIEGRLKLDQWESEGVKKSKHTVQVDTFSFVGGDRQAQQPQAQSRPVAQPAIPNNAYDPEMGF